MAMKKQDKDIMNEEIATVEIDATPITTTPSVEDIAKEAKKAEENTVEVETTDNVKIRMRANHRCCIAGERYNLVAGKVYVVPKNVKRILNGAGLLSPI